MIVQSKNQNQDKTPQSSKVEKFSGTHTTPLFVGLLIIILTLIGCFAAHQSNNPENWNQIVNIIKSAVLVLVGYYTGVKTTDKS